MPKYRQERAAYGLHFGILECDDINFLAGPKGLGKKTSKLRPIQSEKLGERS